MENKYDSIIYGKSDIENIVSIEVFDGCIHCFIETDTDIDIVKFNAKPWVLASQNLGQSMVKLKGNQYFRYGKQFPTIQEFNEFKHKNYVKDIFTIHNLKENIMINKGLTYFKGMKIEDVSVLSFDIETNGFKMDANSKVFLISNTYRKGNTTIKRLFSVDCYPNMGAMINDWCCWVNEVNPSVITGHNIVAYDLPFLSHCFDISGYIGLFLGRDRSVISFNDKESKFRVDGTRDLHYHKVSIHGREVIDTMFLAYRYDIGRKYESYGLKPIIKQEGLEDPNRTFYDAMTIKDNWDDPKEREFIKAYAKDDADDALKLYYLMAPSIFYMTQSVPKPFQLMTESATGSQLNAMMVRAYLQQGHSVAKASEVSRFEGAYSWGAPGVYRNVFKMDVSSLYPSIMLQYEIFDNKKDPELYLKKILDFYRDSRLQYKKLAKETKDPYYSAMDQLGKIMINSMYGFMGATGLNYNYPFGASEVTRYGRETLAFCVQWATGKDIKDFISSEELEEDDE
jgi:DNA polymerase I